MCPWSVTLWGALIICNVVVPHTYVKTARVPPCAAHRGSLNRRSGLLAISNSADFLKTAGGHYCSSATCVFTSEELTFKKFTVDGGNRFMSGTVNLFVCLRACLAHVSGDTVLFTMALNIYYVINIEFQRVQAYINFLFICFLHIVLISEMSISFKNGWFFVSLKD